MPGERFSVRQVPEDGGPADRVTVEVGLEGLNILAPGGGRALRKYPLHHISRWSMRGTSLILFTKSPVDVEDQVLTLQGDEHTIRSVLDTLTCSCMQMAEMLQSGQTSLEGAVGQQAANSLNMLLKKSRKPALLTADQVEFWKDPEKAGWMHSQGEHIRTWRKRWFVLKQGFLFRFASPDVSASSKPRGILDLSSVTDVGDGAATTGKPHSIKVSTANGHVCYVCDSETAQVEWVSALEGAVARIVKLVAGLDDEQPGPSSSAAGSTAQGSSSWADRLERNWASASAGGGGSGGGAGGSSSRASGLGSSSAGGGRTPQMVTVVNYGAGSEGPGRAAPNGYGQQQQQQLLPAGYVSVDYGTIAGAQAIDMSRPGGGGADVGGGYQPYQPLPHLPQQQNPFPAEQQQYGGAPAMYSYAPQPQQQLALPSLMDAVTAPQPSMPQPPAAQWAVHYTAEGRPYWHNSATGQTQWDPPQGL